MTPEDTIAVVSLTVILIVAAVILWFGRDRTRYSVWYVAESRDHRERMESGLRKSHAERDAASMDGALEWMKSVAPSGPQDAHHVVLPDDAKWVKL